MLVSMATAIQSDLDRFYRLLGIRSTQLGGPRQLAHCDNSSGWPERGVYFFFEEAERRSTGTDGF
jgi:hypothetical protein